MKRTILKEAEAEQELLRKKRKKIMDITHYYIEKGTGFPLILLHGNGENSSYFEHQMDAFSKDFKVLALDSRGHGKTPRGTADFTIRQFAQDLAEFMEEKKIKKAHILGFSDGANIAMCFASKYPERVSKLVLNGGNLNPKGIRPSVQIPIEIGYRIARCFASKSRKALENTEMLGLMVNDPYITDDELKKIKAETLVIAGTKDMVKRKHSIEIADGIPDARIQFLEGDHFVANKNPEVFNSAVLTFLKEEKRK